MGRCTGVYFVGMSMHRRWNVLNIGGGGGGAEGRGLQGSEYWGGQGGPNFSLAVN